MASVAKMAANNQQTPLALPKVVLDNNHLLSLDYEYGNGALEYVKYS